MRARDWGDASEEDLNEGLSAEGENGGSTCDEVGVVPGEPDGRGGEDSDVGVLIDVDSRSSSGTAVTGR